MDNNIIKEFVQKAQKGDDEAYEILYHEFYPMVFSIALKMSHCDADAKDIAQNTFIQVKQSLHTLQDPAYFRLWLQKVTLSKCKNLFRKNNISTCDIDEHTTETQLSIHQNKFDPVVSAHFHNDQEVLISFIHQLPQPQETVINKMYFQQKTLEEIAEELQIPLGTVKSRAHTAKKQLLHMVQKYEKQNQCRLDFHTSILESTVGGGIIGICMKSTKGITSFLQMGSMNLAILVCSSVLVVSATLGAYQIAKQKYDIQGESEISHLSYSVKKAQFPVVMLDGEAYESAADAYYKLKSFAHCRIEIKDKSPEEKEHIRPLYEELKKFKGTYWNLLVGSGWVEEYEQNKK